MRKKLILVEGASSDENGPVSLVKSVASSIKPESRRNLIRLLESDNPKFVSERNLEEYKKKLELNKGEDCAFILGNGMSIPFGADSWSDLVNNLLDCLNPGFTEKPKDISSTLSHSLYQISSYVEAVSQSEEAKEVYRTALRYCIYRKYTKIMHKKDTLIRAAALAKLKYRNLRVYTYNYDLFLENQIEYEDESRKVPSYSGSSYSTKDKTSIIHLHGVVYNDESREATNLVLTDQQYFNVYLNNSGPEDHWVKRAQIDLLSTKNVLFIGSSMSDLFQLSIIDRVRKEKGGDWKCYALLCFNGLNLSDQKSLLDFYQKRGIFVIFAESFSELPRTLNRITGADFGPRKGRRL